MKIQTETQLKWVIQGLPLSYLYKALLLIIWQLAVRHRTTPEKVVQELFTAVEERHF
jgi:hypothetical protein